MTERPIYKLGSDWQWIVALVIFVCGAFGGFALTALPKLSLQNWGYWVGGRIVWQLGGETSLYNVTKVVASYGP